MKLRILGSDGGIGGHRRTTALMVDEDVLIDAGSGVGDLALEEMAGIRKVLLTHAHLDHVAGLLLLLDTVQPKKARPIVTHGLAATLEALSRHMLNDEVWPDFRRIPSADDPTVVLEDMSPGVALSDRGRLFTMIEVCHSVPAVGYLISGPGGAFAFSGDTSRCEGFWRALNETRRLDLLIVEVSYPDSHADLAMKSGHYHPTSLAQDLERLVHRPEIRLTHLKPGLEVEIRADCERALAGRDFQILRGGEIFNF
ncbi:MAG TPA: 3',5'-cyclic-nucleotide phosphodiesterase [Candidatus Polarisedimenticolia bacterium]